MGKAMKSGSAKAMTKGELLKSIATEHDMKTKDCSNILNSLVTLPQRRSRRQVCSPSQVSAASRPGASQPQACTKMIFGKETKVKAKPAKTVVKAFPAAALKQQI